MGERFTSDLLFILIVLLVAALLGFLIGYYLRKNRKVSCPKCAVLENELEKHTLRINQLVAEIKTRYTFDAAKAMESFGLLVIENDLKIVEGIGEKIAQILNNKGITTWKLLSETAPEKISEYLLAAGGERYRIHKPDTWPLQAKLAYEGNWMALKVLQEHLKGGVATE
jgi:predicted flap endonuclease-1-like 5' DNA nuclease